MNQKAKGLASYSENALRYMQSWVMCAGAPRRADRAHSWGLGQVSATVLTVSINYHGDDQLLSSNFISQQLYDVETVIIFT